MCLCQCLVEVEVADFWKLLALQHSLCDSVFGIRHFGQHYIEFNTDTWYLPECWNRGPSNGLKHERGMQSTSISTQRMQKVIWLDCFAWHNPYRCIGVDNNQKMAIFDYFQREHRYHFCTGCLVEGWMSERQYVPCVSTVQHQRPARELSSKLSFQFGQLHFSCSALFVNCSS